MHAPIQPLALSFLRLGTQASPLQDTVAPPDGLLARALNLLRVGVAFVDMEERPVYANATLLRMAAEQPDGEEIRREIRRFIESMGALARRAQRHEDATEELAVRDFHTSEGSYLLRGSLVTADGGRRDRLMLVALEPAGAEFLSAEVLRSRYGLTAQEVRVARLVTLGLADAEIAAKLCISLHTARHHSEHLRQKLGVRSRGEVAAQVLRVGRRAVDAR